MWNKKRDSTLAPAVGESTFPSCYPHFCPSHLLVVALQFALVLKWNINFPKCEGIMTTEIDESLIQSISYLIYTTMLYFITYNIICIDFLVFWVITRSKVILNWRFGTTYWFLFKCQTPWHWRVILWINILFFCRKYQHLGLILEIGFTYVGTSRHCKKFDEGLVQIPGEWFVWCGLPPECIAGGAMFSRPLFFLFILQ